MIHVGSRVRIADREALEEALGGSTAHLPEPTQFLHAGATARVVHVHFNAAGNRSMAWTGAPDSGANLG